MEINPLTGEGETVRQDRIGLKMQRRRPLVLRKVSHGDVDDITDMAQVARNIQRRFARFAPDITDWRIPYAIREEWEQPLLALEAVAGELELISRWLLEMCELGKNLAPVCGEDDHWNGWYESGDDDGDPEPEPDPEPSVTGGAA